MILPDVRFIDGRHTADNSIHVPGCNRNWWSGVRLIRTGCIQAPNVATTYKMREDEIMFIGELASRAGVSVQAVRLYEQRGLMRLADRSAAGYRVYQPLDFEILSTIKRCQELGLTLAEIKRVTRILMGGAKATAGNSDRCLREIEAIGVAKLAAMDAEIRELTAQRDALVRTLNQIRSGMTGNASKAIDPVPR